MAWLRRAVGHLPDPLLRKLAGYFMASSARKIQGLSVRLATSAADLIAASRLVHDAYVARGLIAPNRSGCRATPHALLPSTATFVALDGEAIVGTISLVPDGPMGLPMEKIYSEEVSRLRAQGRRIGEVGALCVADNYRRKGVAFLLYRLLWKCAADQLKLDDLIIAVHPDAAPVYRAALMFERIGEVQSYPGLNRSALAVALRLDLRTTWERFAAAFGTKPSATNPYYWFGMSPTDALEMPPMDFAERVRIAKVSAAMVLAPTCHDALQELRPSLRRYLSEALLNRLSIEPTFATRLRSVLSVVEHAA